MTGEGMGYPETSPESPQIAAVDPVAGTTTPGTPGEALHRAAGGQENHTGVTHYPDVRLLRGMPPWSDSGVVAIRHPVGGHWELTNGDKLLPDSLPAKAERMVPVGPLLAYIEDLDIRAAIASELAEGVSADCLEGYAGKAEARDLCARTPRSLLDSLLGESPEGGEARDA